MPGDKPTIDFEEMTRILNNQNAEQNTRNANAAEEARLDEMNRIAREQTDATIERNKARFEAEQQKKAERDEQRRQEELRAAETERLAREQKKEKDREKYKGFFSTVKSVFQPPEKYKDEAVERERIRMRERKEKERQAARQHRLDQKKLDREQKENAKRIAAEEKQRKDGPASVVYEDASKFYTQPTEDKPKTEQTPVPEPEPQNEAVRVIPPELQELKDTILQTETVTEEDLEALLPMLDRDDLLSVAIADKNMDTLLIISADALKEILPTMHIECMFVYLLTLTDAIYVGTHGTAFREMTDIMNSLRESMCKTRWRLTPETVASVPELLIFNHVKGGC